jgi:hypothetical protein
MGIMTGEAACHGIPACILKASFGQSPIYDGIKVAPGFLVVLVAKNRTDWPGISMERFNIKRTRRGF